MTVISFAVLTVLPPGGTWAGTAGWNLLFSRSDRRVRNLIAIGLGYLRFATLNHGTHV
jgi:hypothetical protein